MTESELKFQQTNISEAPTNMGEQVKKIAKGLVYFLAGPAVNFEEPRKVMSEHFGNSSKRNELTPEFKDPRC